MHRVRRHTHEARLELTPLLDIMFLLLAFFIFAAVLVVRLKVTDVHLPPVAGGGEVRRAAAITVALRAGGELFVNDQPVALDDVAAAVTREKVAAPDAALLIAADEAAPSGELFKLMDRLQGAGFQDLRFLRMPKERALPVESSAPR